MFSNLTKKRGFEVSHGNENIFNITTFSNSLGHNLYLSGKWKTASQILMENLEGTENFFWWQWHKREDTVEQDSKTNKETKFY